MNQGFSARAAMCLGAVLVMVQATQARAESPRTLKLGRIELQQNGSGFRKKSLLTLYEGALYLQQPAADAAAIIAAESPMAIRIQITSGFVSRQNMLEALNEGFRNATGGHPDAIAEQIQQFRSCFDDPIGKNDVFVLSYIPGSGVLVHKNGQQKGLIAGAEFKQALFGIWLSDRPADAGLKQALLGN